LTKKKDLTLGSQKKSKNERKSSRNCGGLSKGNKTDNEKKKIQGGWLKKMEPGTQAIEPWVQSTDGQIKGRKKAAGLGGGDKDKMSGKRGKR